MEHFLEEMSLEYASLNFLWISDLSKDQYTTFIEMMNIPNKGLKHLSNSIRQYEIIQKLERNSDQKNPCDSENVVWYIYETHCDMSVLYIIHVLNSYIDSTVNRRVKDYLSFLQRI